jgi:hypothetical protein
MLNEKEIFTSNYYLNERIKLPHYEKILEKIKKYRSSNLTKIDKKLFNELNKRNLINWGRIASSHRTKISETFLSDYIKYMSKKTILYKRRVSEKFLEKHFNELPFDYILKYQMVSERFFRKYIQYYNGDYFTKYHYRINVKKINTEFLEFLEKKEMISFQSIANTSLVPLDYLMKNINKIKTYDLFKDIFNNRLITSKIKIQVFTEYSKKFKNVNQLILFFDIKNKNFRRLDYECLNWLNLPIYLFIEFLDKIIFLKKDINVNYLAEEISHNLLLEKEVKEKILSYIELRYL